MTNEITGTSSQFYTVSLSTMLGTFFDTGPLSFGSLCVVGFLLNGLSSDSEYVRTR